jgi:hypothetical protein
VDVEGLLAADEVFCTGIAVVVNRVGSITYATRRYNTVYCPILAEFFLTPCDFWLGFGCFAYNAFHVW